MTPKDRALHLQLRISLREEEPEIWRQVVVPSNMRLDQLHRVLQIVMGWSNNHLYQFEIGDDFYGDLDEDDDSDEGDLDAAEYTLGEVAATGDRFSYLYDFGDSWKHEVAIENSSPSSSVPTFAVCLDGGRACPPEDCGGALRYEHLLAVLADSTHPEYSETVEWLGKGFDPSRIDLAGINATLQRR